MAYGILIMGWSLFCLLHTFLAGESCKAFFQAKMKGNFKYYRLLYSFVAIITLVAVLWRQLSITPWYFIVPSSVQRFIAIPFAVIAATLTAVCIRKYFYKLSGVEVLCHQPDDPVLETGGIHKFVRHPLYVSTLLLIWSLLLLFPSASNLIACIIITVYVRIGISSEERRLVRIFGTQYENYKDITPMLIPRFFRFLPYNRL